MWAHYVTATFLLCYYKALTSVETINTSVKSAENFQDVEYE